jgi:cell division protein FtsW
VGPWYFLTRHVMFLAVGLVLAAIAMRTELKTIEQYSQLLLLGCFVLLLLVFVPGARQHRQWRAALDQPGRVQLPGRGGGQAVLYIVWLASYLKRYSEDVAVTWMAMLKPVAVVARWWCCC